VRPVASEITDWGRLYGVDADHHWKGVPWRVRSYELEAEGRLRLMWSHPLSFHPIEVALDEKDQEARVICESGSGIWLLVLLSACDHVSEQLHGFEYSDVDSDGRKEVLALMDRRQTEAGTIYEAEVFKREEGCYHPIGQLLRHYGRGVLSYIPFEKDNLGQHHERWRPTDNMINSLGIDLIGNRTAKIHTEPGDPIAVHRYAYNKGNQLVLEWQESGYLGEGTVIGEAWDEESGLKPLAVSGTEATSQSSTRKHHRIPAHDVGTREKPRFRKARQRTNYWERRWVRECKCLPDSARSTEKIREVAEYFNIRKKDIHLLYKKGESKWWIE